MAQRTLIPFLFGGQPATRSGPDPLTALQRQMDRLFEDAFRRLPETTGAVAPAAPRIDISETDNAIIVRAEMPGVDLDDIEVVADEDLLTIRGEKQVERDTDQENFHVVERAVGSFARAIRLPFPVDPAGIQADFENGVLTITVSKPAEAQQRSQRVNVRAGNRQVQSQGPSDQIAAGLSAAGQSAAGQNLGEAADAIRSANAPQKTAGGDAGKSESAGQTASQTASAGSSKS
jgi:HSP20 family protein